MSQEFKMIEEAALAAIKGAKDLDSLNDVRNTYLSKKGIIMGLMGQLRDLPGGEKKAFGESVNKLKADVETAFNVQKEQFEAEALSAKLASETIDISLPGRKENLAPQHPFHLIKDEITTIFLGMGYTVAEGEEVEEDLFNFTYLNMPENHPARDMQDSFYLSKTTLLRTHTSPVQARVMQHAFNKPLKIISPGKVYRRDDDDTTHSHQFGQIEGLVIAENLSLGNLKATLELFVKKMFGPKREIRFRSSYFPFTEPSVEVDVSCHECNGKGCATCKGTGWIEILGAGMVNPNVLAINGYDTNKYMGFAFGVGIERVAMLRYGIDDIRRFYQNDVRFLDEFNKR